MDNSILVGLIELLTLQVAVDLLAKYAEGLLNSTSDLFLDKIAGLSGDALKARLRTLSKSQPLPRQLLKAARQAGQCFLEKCNDLELQSTELMAPLAGTESLSKALDRFPGSLGETTLHQAVTGLFHSTWPNLDNTQRQSAVSIYMDCLRLALLEIPQYGQKIVDLAVLRIDRTVEQIAEAVDRDRYERSLTDYLAALHKFCSEFPYLAIEDLLGDTQKLLSEVYVPLRARSRTQRPSMGDISISDVLHQAIGRVNKTPILILGQPGAGKSTLMRQIADHAWDNPYQIGLDKPYLSIVVRLQALALAEGTAIESRLRNALDITGELVLQEGLPDGFMRTWSQTKNAQWLFLLDGLDEVPETKRQAFMRWLQGFLTEFVAKQGHLAVLTARPVGSLPLTTIVGQHGVYELLPFTPEQQRTFAKRWFGRRASKFLKELEQVRAGDLRGTPLLLTIEAGIYGKDGHLPKKHVDLYERFVKIWLDEAYKHRNLGTEIGEDLTYDVEEALRYLAFVMTERPEDNSVEALSGVAAEYLQKKVGLRHEEAEARSSTFIQALGRHSGVFICQAGTCTWVHPTFREYFVAQKLAQDIRDGNHETLGRLFWQYGVSDFLRNLLTKKEDGEAVTRILRSEDSNPTSRFQAVVLTGQLHIMEAKGLLEDLLAQPDLDHKLLREVHLALANLGDPEAAYKYVAICKSDPLHAKRNKDYTLNYFYDVIEATRALMRHLDDHDYWNRRIHDIYTMGQVADSQALPHLQDIANSIDEDPRIIQEAIEAIETIKSRHSEI